MKSLGNYPGKRAMKDRMEIRYLVYIDGPQNKSFGIF